MLVVTRASGSCGMRGCDSYQQPCVCGSHRAPVCREGLDKAGETEKCARERAAPEQLHSPKASSVSKSNSRRGSTVLPVLNSVRSFCIINLLNMK